MGLPRHLAGFRFLEIDILEGFNIEMSSEVHESDRNIEREKCSQFF